MNALRLGLLLLLRIVIVSGRGALAITHALKPRIRRTQLLRLTMVACFLASAPLVSAGAKRPATQISMASTAALLTIAATASSATRPGIYSPSLTRIGIHRLSPDFIARYKSLRKSMEQLLAFEPSFERPPPLPTRDLTRGNRFVKPLNDRIVKVDGRDKAGWDRLPHFQAAKTCTVPAFEWRSKYQLPSSCCDAIRIMLAKRARLGRWRRSQIRSMRAICTQSRRLDRELKRLNFGSESVQRLAKVRTVNVAMLCLFTDVLQHPDTTLPYHYLTGFNVTGVIEDSGVHRPIPLAVTDDEFWETFRATMVTNAEWAKKVANSITNAFVRAGRDRRDLLEKVWSLTRKEIDEGIAGSPMTLSQLESKYGSGEKMRCRVLARSGIFQGWKPLKSDDGSVILDQCGDPVLVEKIRLIDNSKTSLTNSHLQLHHETVAPCRFTYMANVCEEIVRQCDALQRTVPRVVFSMHDQKQAYRQVPTSDPEMCVVCAYCCEPNNVGPRFVEVRGHNFGHRSSVVNYVRTPILFCQIARHFFAVPQEAYVDDFCVPCFKGPAGKTDQEGAAALAAVHDMQSFKLEALKTQPPAQVNTFLGVECDVSQVTGAVRRNLRHLPHMRPGRLT